MKRRPLILSLALLLLLPAIALYPMLQASAEKDGVDSSTAIQEAAPSEAAPSDSAADIAASVSVGGSIDTGGFSSPTASSRRFTAIWPPTTPRWGT